MLDKGIIFSVYVIQTLKFKLFAKLIMDGTFWIRPFITITNRIIMGIIINIIATNTAIDLNFKYGSIQREIGRIT